MVPPPASCCTALAALLAQKVVFPASSGYNQSLGSYFSAQEAEVHPSCIVLPATPNDVSRAVGTLSRRNCSFAVRSGGHTTWAGDANIANGVTIDLQGLASISVHQSGSSPLVSVGPGARWGNVYRALEASQLVVPGGRVGTVGVGGLTTGGGLSSFTPRYGWTCDSVANMEVVLASGDIVNANDTHNADLLHALRGGSNNFGVVTRFDYHAYPQGDIWGGTVNYDISTLPQQLKAVSKLASSDHYDEYASIVMNIVYSPGGNLSISNGLQYTKAVAYPEFMKPLTDIAHSSENLRVANLSNFADEGAAGNQNGLRTILATTTHGTTLEMFQAAFDTWNKTTTASFAGTSILQARLFSEPVPHLAYSRAASGTNSLGLSEARGNLVIVGVAVAWGQATDDALVDRVTREVVGQIDAAAQRLGQHNRYKFLNYAAPWQDVVGGYGPQSQARLRQASKVYDPRGVFQKKVPGGFKVL
ncbi:hypothetical protein PG988_004672 [Apiospora saccharicola]